MLSSALSAAALAFAIAAMNAQQLPRHLPIASHSSTRTIGGHHLPPPRLRPADLPTNDTVPTFNGTYQVYGYDDNNQPQTQWSYTMLGNGPGSGTTTIPVKIVAVTVEFVHANGEVVNMSFDSNLDPVVSQNGTPLRFEMSDADLAKVVASPLFSPVVWPQANNDPSPAQYGDAYMHAQFPSGSSSGSSNSDWHTLLIPQVVTRRTIHLPLTCIADGNCRFAPSADYKRVAGIAVAAALFDAYFSPQPGAPVDASTILGAGISSGELTTRDISVFLLPNVVLLNTDASTGNQTASLGEHFALAEPGDASNGNRDRLYVANLATYPSQEFANAVGEGNYVELASLSAQLGETFADPFSGNKTPWWTIYPFEAPLPGFPISIPWTGACNSNYLEVAQTTAPNPGAESGQKYWSPVYPVRLNNNNYYVANLALLSWFGAPSPQGVYSFPDMLELYAPSPPDMQPFELNGNEICVQVAPGTAPPTITPPTPPPPPTPVGGGK